MVSTGGVRLLSTVLLAVASLLLGAPVPAPAGPVQRPIPVPGRVEAEDYDLGGPGKAFHDDGPGNNGGVYRHDDVDIEACTDTGGGYAVAWIGAGEWLNYTLAVKETALYRVDFRVASGAGTGRIDVSIDDIPACSVNTPATGGWKAWKTVSLSNIVLQAGQRLMRLDFTGGFNLNHLQITRQGALTGRFLRVSGKQIVDGDGHNLILRGMGLGNWMLQEPYMMEVSGIAATQQKLKKKLSELVGPENTRAFYAAWLTNYTTPGDVQALATNGFNSIRLPIHYDLLTLTPEQEPTPGSNTWLEPGFTLIDNLLSWCAANRIYLILDMHACPGGQGKDEPISDYNPPAPSLWESDVNRAKLTALWREIARRYAREEWIGGYDLINEPNWTFENNSNKNGCNDVTNAPLWRMMKELTAAVREMDTNHIIYLMGNCWGGNYKGLPPAWDSQLVIGFHKYWDPPTPESLQPWVNRRNDWNMPLWLGETGENSNEWFREVVCWCERFNIGWAWWPWKKLTSISGPVTVQRPEGYQRILDYWKKGGPRPSTNEAVASLMALAEASRIDHCTLHPDVFDALIRPETQGSTLPFKPHPIPGIVPAAEYDLGRRGEAYFDATTTNAFNAGHAFRNESVDIQTSTDSPPSNGFNVGWTEAGEWLKYTVSPTSPGPYRVAARVATTGDGGTFRLEVNGMPATGDIRVSDTGGWQKWQTLPLGVVTNAGPITSFKIVILSGNFNIGWISFEK